MLIDKIEQSNVSRFPWDIFSPEIYLSFKNVAANSNIPLDYLGTQALFSVASLAGNMYIADINGGVKPIIFIAKVGPSGVGKTPAYHKLLGDITAPLRAKYADDYEKLIKDYRQRERDCRDAKPKISFDEEPPVKRIRIVEGGTVEALAKHSVNSPAGFGIVYDEGERMFSEINKYNNGGTSMAFWNEVFNGKAIELTRVDQERERFIRNPAISVDIGLQSDRMYKYFTDDAIASGILNRFLMVESGYIKLNENVDFFTKTQGVHDDWRSMIKYLFEEGLKFNHGESKRVQVEQGTWAVMNTYGRAMVAKSNALITEIKDGDASKYLSAYRAKLFLYFQRLALIIAIMKDARNPVITRECVDGAKKLCIYYEKTAINILTRLFETNATGLTENEKRLYDSLPPEFNSAQAAEYCEALSINAKFFQVAFRQKYIRGFIRKVGKGMYEKI